MARQTKEQSDQLRAALRRFMKFKDFSVAERARQAGIPEGTLRNFLAGTSETLTHATLAALVKRRGSMGMQIAVCGNEQDH
jgi:hypothetical protein